MHDSHKVENQSSSKTWRGEERWIIKVLFVRDLRYHTQIGLSLAWKRPGAV